MKSKYLACAAVAAAFCASSHGGIPVQIRDRVGGEMPDNPANGFYLTGTSSFVNATLNGGPFETQAMGAFDLEIDTGGGFSPFITYCIEPEAPLGFGLNPTDNVGIQYQTDTLVNAGYTPGEADMIEILWSNAFALSQTDILNAAAFQAVLWELHEDNTVNFFGDNFSMNFAQFHTNSVANLAQQWVDNINGGIWTSSTNLVALTTDGSQNFLMPTVIPSPGALSLLAVSSLLCARSRRRSA